jgi:hypothetical protein
MALNLNNIYDSDSSRNNWYKQRPYTFVFTDKNDKSYYFNLPISPSNLNITTHFATNLIPTMYGTVEEHSEQRYFDITISGTTGIAPSYHEPHDMNRNFSVTPLSSKKNNGRGSYKVTDGINLGGFAQRSIDLLRQATDRASDVLGPSIPKPGIAVDQTGYVAFHNFYKFLLNYKKDVSNSKQSGRSEHPLKFVNYKDNNKYDVSISTFQLTRDASNPMLYNYSIVMRAYNLRNALDKFAARFGEAKEEAELLKKLGLDGVKSSVFSKMANKVRLAKATAYAAIAAAKGVGK